MAEIQIRKIKKGDGTPVMHIIKSIAKYPIKVDYERIVEEEAERMENGSFVAVSHKKVIGFIISYVLSGVFGIENCAWIAMIGIDPKYMDQGVGKRLANELFKFYKAKGILNIFTSVRWDSADMLSYFKTIGFDRSSYINLVKTLD